MKWIWGRNNDKEILKGLVAVHETALGISMAYAAPKADPKELIIKAYNYQPTPEVEQRQAALGKFVLDHGLEGAACSYVLPINDYTLTLSDAPNVAAEEVSQAMRWLMRDVVNYPIEDALIDAFELPLPRARDNVKMAYGIAIRKTLIPRIEKLIRDAQLSLKSIDIPELALRNVVSYHPEDAKGCAFIQLYPTGGKLIISRGGMIYITRTIELKLEALNGEISGNIDSKVVDQLALEIQRSFDYLSSVFRQTMANSIVLAPTLINTQELQITLKNALGMEVYKDNISETISFEQPISEIDQANCLLAIGGALRPEEGEA